MARSHRTSDRNVVVIVKGLPRAGFSSTCNLHVSVKIKKWKYGC